MSATLQGKTGEGDFHLGTVFSPPSFIDRIFLIGLIGCDTACLGRNLNRDWVLEFKSGSLSNECSVTRVSFKQFMMFSDMTFLSLSFDTFFLNSSASRPLFDSFWRVSFTLSVSEFYQRCFSYISIFCIFAFFRALLCLISGRLESEGDPLIAVRLSLVQLGRGGIFTL